MSTNFPNGVSAYGAPILPNLNPWAQVWFVDGNQGKAGADGRTPQSALKTFTELFALTTNFRTLKSGDVVFVRGNINENVTTPAGVFDVTVIGAGNKPRHADAHTTNGGFSAATWGKSPASSSTPLIKVQQQGWKFMNILFECPNTSSGIQFFRDGGAGDAERDGSHGMVVGCRFDGGVNGGQEGIEASGGPNFLRIEDNLFRGLDAGIKSTTGAGIGTNGWWEILDNRFEQNVRHINVDMDRGFIKGNISGAFTTAGFDLAGGTVGLNHIHGNYLSGDYDAGYVAGTSDDWAGNYSMDVSSGEVGAEGLTTAAPIP
jgi:hypothetical protein